MSDEQLVDVMRGILLGLVTTLLRDGGLDNESIAKLHYDAAVTRIDQAYKDEGYMPPHTVNGLDLAKAAQYMSMMTGQEWYERFEKELPDNETDCAEFYVGNDGGCDPETHNYRSGRFNMRREAIQAAKRAAGLQ